mgnify:CR=1 FL=1
MTLEELKNFNPNTHDMYFKSLSKSDPKKVTVKYLYGDFFYPSIKIIFPDGSGYAKFIGDNLGQYDFVELVSNKTSEITKYESERYCKCFETKPKLKESKMKTTFKQEPTKTLENSFPKFMKYNKSPLVVLFFNENSGIVVAKDNYHKENEFGDDWDISLFEPIENCEVTFSNKE